MNVAGLQKLMSNVSPKLKANTAAPTTGSGFGSLLDNAKLMNSDLNSERGKLSMVLSGNDQKVDIKQLLAALSNMIEELPMEEGYLSLEMVNNPEIQKLLQQLPDELTAKINQFFKREIPVDGLLSEELTSAPEGILSLIITMAQLESQKSLPDGDKDLTQLTNQVENVMGININDKPISFEDFLMTVQSSLQASNKETEFIFEKNISSNSLNSINEQKIDRLLMNFGKLINGEKYLTDQSFLTALEQSLIKESPSNKEQKLMELVLSEVNKLVEKDLLTNIKGSNDTDKQVLQKDLKLDQLVTVLKNLKQSEQFPKVNEKFTTEIAKTINQFIENNNVLIPNKSDLYESIKKEILRSLDTENVNKMALNRQIDSSVVQRLLKQIDASSQVTVRTDLVSEFSNSVSAEQSPMNRIQQYVLHVNEQQPKQTSQQSIMDQFSKILKQSKFTNMPNGNNQLLLKLNPEHLGSLSIKLTQINGEMVAKIIASTATAKELIESNLNQLRNVFSVQNINLEKLEVQVESDQQFEQFKEQQNNEQRQNEQEEKEGLSNNEDSEGNSNSFQEELLNLMA